VDGRLHEKKNPARSVQSFWYNIGMWRTNRQQIRTDTQQHIWNESELKIIINDTINLISILLISNHSSFRGCLIKLLPYILVEKYIYILALEMASPWNAHCANCIGTLSFSIARENSVARPKSHIDSICIRSSATNRHLSKRTLLT